MKKLVTITGAASGFGLETAKLFSSLGHPLLLISLEKEMPKELDLPNSIYTSVDVTDYSELASAISKAEETYGKTDLLVNNAGVMLLGSIIDQEPNEWQKMMDINVMGVLNGMQIVIKDMVERNEGTIINISSIAGIKPFGAHAAYCATKYGVRAMSEVIREEVSSSNVRVLVISPGAADTALLTQTTSEVALVNYNAWVDNVLEGAKLDPKQVANAARYMYELPQEVSIREVVIAATKQDA